MRLPWRRKGPRPPRTMRRSFVTPEGIDLQLELGGAGARAGAFTIDATIMLVLLILATVAIAYSLSSRAEDEAAKILWLLGFFTLRNGWFALFEMGGRGATPGKRLLKLRVVARDGARLTGGAVIARNAMREIEVFLPLSFLGWQTSQGAADGFLVLFALTWSGLFLFFPLFNRDRLRLGDLVAGTWVVRTGRDRLAHDLGVVARERRTFSDAALGLYGIYELQTLEEVLRGGRAESIQTVAAMIRAKANLPWDGDDRGFLEDYYAALCVRLERAMLMGRRRENKFAA